MRQKVSGEPLSDEAACGIAMGPDEPTLILLRHCRDMKQQETRLRISTLLLLLSCTALYVFVISPSLRSAGNQGAMQQTFAYSTQNEKNADCPTHNTRQRIELKLERDDSSSGRYLAFRTVHGKDYYNPEKRAIVIQQTGFYFVYARTALHYQNFDEPLEFFIAIQQFNSGYKYPAYNLSTWESIHASSGEFKNVYLGQMFDLTQGDYLKLWINESSSAIKDLSFGAFLL